jgi:hypothetical protein
MRKVALGLWAGAWLLVAIGCASSDVMGTLFLQGGNERVVVGSLEDVAKSTQGTLQRLKLKADLTQQGDKIFIDSALESGARFRLVLTQDKKGGAEQTHVRLEWSDKGAEHMTLDILSRLEKAR